MKHNLLKDPILDEFKNHLEAKGKSVNTISSYITSVRKYLEWFIARYGTIPGQLFSENITDYKLYMTHQNVGASTFNARLAGLRAWNHYLIAQGVQTEYVIAKNDNKIVQKPYASPATHTEQDIQRFLQTVLEGGSKRDYALVTLLAYAGLRISEALYLKINDIHFEARELEVKDSKGNKTRTVFLSDRVVRSIKKYLKDEREQYRLSEVSPYLFLSNRSQQLSRVTVYKSFEKYTSVMAINPPITPHDLRHFFCSNALEKGFDVHEVASMAGHSNIHTTLLYTNPSRKKILEKINSL
ncbi:integrase/recombinase XerD [Geomicrobium halophilum]|uniref:Integrase/recombinase XerD n=1 Tax=Geomicrobium halophilum TaxID=549000 RepID=A0A841PYZ6_9BACL|nr:tyrosine-type recombinase/integrase [Geomicrobium halophilum]MBB6449722.1 integrase/recombinase XerD [Geomicrobium halophilum]